jgi:predicted ester cyclase
MQTATVIRRLFEEVLTEGRLDVLDQIIAPDYRDRTPAPGLPSDRSGVRLKLVALRTAFSDLRFTVDELVAEADIAAVRWHWTGIQVGQFGTIAPTGRKVGVRSMDFYRVQDGRIVEHWDLVDQQGLLQEPGAASGP